ncbi:CmcJ/NvfI family oxidoreductase [Cupriavidus necator]
MRATDLGRQEQSMLEPRDISATVQYSEKGNTPPAKYFFEPDPPVAYRKPGTAPRSVVVQSAWPRSATLTLDRQGFKAVRMEEPFHDYDNDAAIRSVYFRQVRDLLRRETGATRVELFDYTIRRSSTTLTNQSEVNRPPSMLAHVDYTADSARKRVRDIFPHEADALLSRRVMMVNVWKPLFRKVESYPLALCDATSHREDDFIKMDLVYCDRRGEILVMLARPYHQWYYFPMMTEKDAILLKTFDSMEDGRSRFVGHAAIEDPNTPANAPPRESIEVRAMVFY